MRRADLPRRAVPDYKANRPPMPDDLRAQIEPMMKIVAGARPADPARARRRGRRRDRHAGGAGRTRPACAWSISTGDKDMAQLVRPQVSLVNTMSGGKPRFRRRR
jgi:DNA polymerase-1